jgi:dihydrofolate reductase
MSLDGFITGPSEGPDNGLGDGGERLHDWMFDGKSDPDAEVVDEVYARTGAIIIGKRMFDVGVGPWGDPPAFHVPVFVVTHEAREPLVKQGGTTYTFVSGGIKAALEQAKAAARDKDVGVWGRERRTRRVGANRSGSARTAHRSSLPRARLRARKVDAVGNCSLRINVPAAAAAAY